LLGEITKPLGVFEIGEFIQVEGPRTISAE